MLPEIYCYCAAAAAQFTPAHGGFFGPEPAMDRCIFPIGEVCSVAGVLCERIIRFRTQGIALPKRQIFPAYAGFPASPCGKKAEKRGDKRCDEKYAASYAS